MNPVNLKELIDCLEIQPDEGAYNVNRNTGEITYLTEDDLANADEFDGIIEGQIDIFSDEYVRIPSKWDIHEYAIMQDFIFSLQPGQAQNDLRYAIKGRGAFKMFKSTLRHYNLEAPWYDFLHEQLKIKAIRWCEDNQLSFM